MKKILIAVLVTAFLGGSTILGVQLVEQGLKSLGQWSPSVEVNLVPTPSTVTVTGPAILDAIRNQARLETVEMVIANDQDISRKWGFENVCQESLTYMAYFTVTAGVDLNDPAGTEVILDGSGVPAETSVTLRLPPARILHVELDTQHSRVVHSDPSILSQVCGTQLPVMVTQAQANLQHNAQASALQQGIVKMAQDRASFELQKILLKLGFTNVNVEFNEAYDDQPD
jgi:hypothetical protein